jgi:hemolysin III
MTSPLRHTSNEIVSGVLHLLGAISGVALIVVLVVFAALHGNVWHVTSFTVYGACMILLYLASTIYHLVPHTKERAKTILQRIDHAIVYVFIAATYTPVCFLVLDGSSRWIVFGILWGLACLGAALKLTGTKTHYAVPLFLYLSMGWFIIFFLPTLLTVMSTTALTLLILGGVSYTLGVIFFVLESKLTPRKYFWMHELFHVFVLGGTTLHTVMMFLLL